MEKGSACLFSPVLYYSVHIHFAALWEHKALTWCDTVLGLNEDEYRNKRRQQHSRVYCSGRLDAETQFKVFHIKKILELFFKA